MRLLLVEVNFDGGVGRTSGGSLFGCVPPLSRSGHFIGPSDLAFEEEPEQSRLLYRSTCKLCSRLQMFMKFVVFAVRSFLWLVRRRGALQSNGLNTVHSAGAAQTPDSWSTIRRQSRAPAASLPAGKSGRRPAATTPTIPRSGVVVALFTLGRGSIKPIAGIHQARGFDP